MKIKRFNEEIVNESQKLNEKLFDKLGNVKNMEIISVDTDEAYQRYLKITVINGDKYYAKVKSDDDLFGWEED